MEQRLPITEFGFDINNIIRGRPRTPPGARLAPMPSGARPFAGHIPFVREDPLAFFLRSYRECGDLARFRMGPMTVHLASHPRHAKLMLIEQHRLFTKNTRGFTTLRLLLGNGLLTSSGAFWLRQRRIAQPAFHRKRIENFGKLMVRATEDTARRWERRANSGQAIDVLPEMMRLTLTIVAEALFGANISANSKVVAAALEYVIEYLNRRIHSLFTPPLTWPIGGNRKFVEHRDELDRIVREMIDTRRSRRSEQEDLLSMLMDAEDEETGERMTDEQLRDEVMTLFLAGHETTANALTWTFYLLAQHADARAKLYEEVDALSFEELRVENLERLAYTRNVIQESLRLYPPVWAMGRAPSADTEIDGFFIPRGSLVFLSPYVIHRNPEIWTEPDRFRPERFESPEFDEVPRLAHMPFGGGPHQCIGNNFALLEAQLVLARLAKQFELSIDRTRPPGLHPLITLRPRNGMWMTIHRRSNDATSE